MKVSENAYYYNYYYYKVVKVTARECFGDVMTLYLHQPVRLREETLECRILFNSIVESIVYNVFNSLQCFESTKMAVSRGNRLQSTAYRRCRAAVSWEIISPCSAAMF